MWRTAARRCAHRQLSHLCGCWCTYTTGVSSYFWQCRVSGWCCVCGITFCLHPNTPPLSCRDQMLCSRLPACVHTPLTHNTPLLTHPFSHQHTLQPHTHPTSNTPFNHTQHTPTPQHQSVSVPLDWSKSGGGVAAVKRYVAQLQDVGAQVGAFVVDVTACLVGIAYVRACLRVHVRLLLFNRTLTQQPSHLPFLTQQNVYFLSQAGFASFSHKVSAATVTHLTYTLFSHSFC